MGLDLSCSIHWFHFTAPKVMNSFTMHAKIFGFFDKQTFNYFFFLGPAQLSQRCHGHALKLDASAEFPPEHAWWYGHLARLELRFPESRPTLCRRISRSRHADLVVADAYGCLTQQSTPRNGRYEPAINASVPYDDATRYGSRRRNELGC